MLNTSLLLAPAVRYIGYFIGFVLLAFLLYRYVRKSRSPKSAAFGIARMIIFIVIGILLIRYLPKYFFSLIYKIRELL